mmetsp:Transcript_82937/g.218901  ORF Transcript_82937/g.218901 Transcript_82937/m.218901 type:complete len:156 (-) Transcript_82937:49-516(-)
MASPTRARRLRPRRGLGLRGGMLVAVSLVAMLGALMPRPSSGPSGSRPDGPLMPVALTIADVANIQDRTTEVVRRAGGVRTLLGSMAVGAVGGTLFTAPLPLLNQFGALGGALAAAWCAQLPEDGSSNEKLGKICRSLGHGATAFLDAFKQGMNS